MHEASIVSALLRQVDELAATRGACRVVVVRVEVGPLSGVEPVLLREAFGRQNATSSASQAELVIDLVDLTCRCDACQLEYRSPTLSFVCPHCQSPRVTVTAGDAVVLESVELVPIEESLPA